MTIGTIAHCARAANATRGGAMFKLLAFLAAVAAAVALAWMTLLPFVVINRIQARTGFAAKVASLAANPLTGTIVVRGFVLENPAEFPAGEFVQVREFTAEADPRTLLEDELVFETMTIDLARVTLVKRADGLTNAKALDQAVAGGGSARDTAERRRTVLVRELELKLAKVVVVEQAAGRTSTREFDVNFVQRSKNVREFSQLLTPAAAEALAPVAAVAGEFLPGQMGQALKAKTKSGAEALKAAGKKTGEVLRGLFDTLEDSAKP